MENHPEFLVERAKRQFDLQIAQQRQQPQTPQPATSDSIIDRLKSGTALLATGVISGSMTGMLIGTVYGISSKHPSPIGLGFVGAMNLGLISGQYYGFRYILPSQIPRLFDKYTQPGDGINELGMIADPSILADWTDTEKNTLYSFLCGGLAGFITTRAQAHSISKAKNVSTGHVNSVGIKGALLYGTLFALGNLSYSLLDRWRVNRVIDRRLRNMYDTNPELIKTYTGSGDVPKRSDVLKMTWSELIRNPSLAFTEYGWSIPDWLPLVHAEQDYEYRRDLEQKCQEAREYRALLEKAKRVRDRVQ